MKHLFLSIALLFAWAANAQTTIASGPMPGYSTLNEVGLWMQLTNDAEVKVMFWPEGKKHLRAVALPDFVEMKHTHIAKFQISDLLPGTVYNYTVIIDKDTIQNNDTLRFNTQKLWQYREDPPAFKVALGSCTYINEQSYDRPGTPYGSNYKIFSSIQQKQPDAMLWLGDNVYLREYDYFSYKGYLHRYNHTRSTKELQGLLRSTHHYAIWDDHDFGPNDANGSWIHKNWALDAFKLYWMNPSYGIPGKPGITTAFSYNDIHFYLLDNRYNRTSDDTKGQKPQILGKDQIEWLIENLKYSRAPFKMVAIGGQVLNPAKVYENHAQYEKEREYLLNRIIEEKIKGVVFLTGDRHHTELRKIEVDDVTIYDLTVSPLTSSTHEAKNESTLNLVPNTVVNQHNFATLEFFGERLARQLKISIFDSEGKEIWTKLIQP
ncbi:MAG: alkaline phosphatase D family protein [Salibacteraceae bacterium]